MKVDWIHAYEIERKVQETLTRQRLNGWAFDAARAERYVDWLDGFRKWNYTKIRPHLRMMYTCPYKTPISKPFLMNGNYSENVKKWFENEEDLSKVAGPFTRIEWEEPNLDSDKQLKELLFELGWIPTQWNYKKDKAGRKIYDENKQPIKTSPKLTEDSYDSLSVGIGLYVADYLKAGHRKSQIEGFLKNVDSNGLIHADANTIGTPTGRMRHRIVVNVPKAKPHVFFGWEMRSLFICRPGRVLVGHDASGLEARMMGHYLNDPELIYDLIHGDFHTKFWIPLKEFINSRDNAKNVEYAYIFGAQNPKLGSMADNKPKGWSDEKTGKAMREIINKAFPALGELTDRVQKAARRRKYLIGLDGRKVWVRSPHSALNTLFQSAGAIVMKKSIVLLEDYKKDRQLDVIKVGDFHDEGQADVAPEDAELYGKLAVQSIVDSGEYFHLNCPLDGEYKIGENWALTH